MLVIDLDQQANLTKSLGQKQKSNERPTFKSLVFKSFNEKTVGLADTVIPLHDYLHLIPSDMSMANFDLELTIRSAGSGVQDSFKPIFDEIRQLYDLVVVDSPPAINSVTLGSTFNSDTLAIPTDPDDFSIDGIDQVFGQLSQAKRKDMKVRPKIFINKMQQGRDHDYKKVAEIYQSYSDFVVKSSIPFTSKFKELINEYNNVWGDSSSKKATVLSYLSSLTLELLEIDFWNEKINKRSKQEREFLADA